MLQINLCVYIYPNQSISQAHIYLRDTPCKKILITSYGIMTAFILAVNLSVQKISLRSPRMIILETKMKLAFNFEDFGSLF